MLEKSPISGHQVKSVSDKKQGFKLLLKDKGWYENVKKKVIHRVTGGVETVNDLDTGTYSMNWSELEYIGKDMSPHFTN